MKVAIDCRMLEMSGIGVFLHNLLNAFISGNSDDNFVLFGNSNLLQEWNELKKVRIVETRVPIFSYREFIDFPVSEVNRCDVFFTPNYNIPGWIRIPIFSTIHDVVFLDIENLVTPIGRLIRSLFLRRALIRSRSVFTVSEFSKNRIEAHFGNAFTLNVIGNGINRALQSFKADDDSPFDFDYFIFVGNIKKHKGLSTLLHAYKQVLLNGYPLKLVVVGAYDSFRTSDISILEECRLLGDDVRFLGKQTDNQLYNLIYHARFLVQPSLYEGFGIPPLEALFLGCPVLLSDISVFREIYSDLPVVFFTVSNVDDLSKALLQMNCRSTEYVSLSKSVLTDRFDYNCIAKRILKIVEV